MTTGSLIMMSVWMGLVTIMSIYFFYRVLTTKPKDAEKDSDDEKEKEAHSGSK